MHAPRKNRKVIWTLESRDDLNSIADYLVNKESLEVSVLVSGDIIDTGDRLNYQATLWRERNDIYPGIRIVFARSYAIIYTVQSSTVSVARVIHGAQDIATILRRTMGSV